MTITINGKEAEISSELSITELLASQDVESPDMVSVQVNGEIVERSSFETAKVAAGDKVEFLYFMGGGK